INSQLRSTPSTKTLLGDDVTEDNFPVRMAALIKRKKQALAAKLAKERIERPMTLIQQRTYMRQFVKNQSSALYSTEWTKAKVDSFTDAQLKEEFEKIQKALANTQVQAISRTLKRKGPELEEPSSNQQKSTEDPILSVPDVPQPPMIPHSSRLFLMRSSSLAVALICLSDGRKFNWSSYIFKGMVSNIGNAKKFLMYPRFLQTILGIETSFTRQYHVFKLSSKLFANMKLNFEGQPMQLLAAMLPQDQEGEGAGVAAQAVTPPIPEPMPTPPRNKTSRAPIALDDDPFTSTNVEDEPLGGSFHASPPRSTQAPPAGHTSGGAEDLITLTAVSSVVSTLVQKVNSLETELKDTKKLFKDVVGKLVKKVKAMEVKLKTKKRKVVVSDSDQEEGGEQDVDLDALLALANAAVIVDSNIPPGGASSSHIPTDVPTGVAPAGVLNKGKTPMVEEDIIVKERTLKQMEDDRLGEEAAKRLHDEEQAQVDRQRAELNRRRQQEVLASAMYYTEADWINIMAQVEANASLSKTLLGDDVTEDNFPVRMAALIKRKKQALVEKLAKERMERPMTPEEFEKIQKALANTQVQAFSRTLKRTGPELEEPSSKQQKSTEAPIPSVPDVPQPPVVSSTKSSGTKRKSLGRNRLTKPKSILKELDLDADDKTFIKVVSDKDSTDDAPILWSALASWEVLIDSQKGGKGSFVWDHQSLWQIRSWRLYTLSNVHVLETVSGEVLYMFADVSYPLSVKLMERMLKHKLEIDKDVVGNDMTTAEQLIRFIKNQIAAAQVSPV
ncbi:hypothetical protein Tco_0765278, partial [Tanacetum coccineum]